MNGFHWWAFQIKNQAVQKIKKSGIPYTIFYPSTFMECLPYQMMRGKRIGMLGRSEMPMWFIAADDYAKQVARSFKQLTIESREYNIQGTEGLKTDEAVKLFIDNYSRQKLTTMSAPVGLLKFMGIFNQRMNYAWRICEALNKYPEKFESETAWKDLGKPEITIKKYAEQLSK
jgi:hypothetical protein